MSRIRRYYRTPKFHTLPVTHIHGISNTLLGKLLPIMHLQQTSRVKLVEMRNLRSKEYTHSYVINENNEIQKIN